MQKVTFTLSSDGHIVGTDGFIVPANYSELVERFPTLIASLTALHLVKPDFRVDRFADIADRGVTAQSFFNYLWHSLRAAA